jgi:HPr kinase/phosphorylase
MTPQTVTAGVLLGARATAFGLQLQLVAGREGLERTITSPHVQKTGLALVGFEEYIRPGRVLVFGESEVTYLGRQPPSATVEILRRLDTREIPCLVTTGGFGLTAQALEECERLRLPVLATRLSTGVAIAKTGALLEERLAERVSLHAVLMDILGLGVLITGESGIGKSECALDLITRGHRLVADDAVEIRARAETVLIGTCPEATRFHMELRGLGLVDVKELFGVAAVRSSKRVELVVQLERWEAGRDYDRLGLDDAWFELLGLRVPLVRMPVAPGRSVATLVEVAARNHLLKARGHHAARTFVEDHAARLRAARGLGAEPDEEDELGNPA